MESIALNKLMMHRSHRNWPFLNRALECGFLSPFDYLLAESLLVHCPDGSEAVAAFICHLSISTRTGHLCIAIKNNTLTPDPSYIWTQEESHIETTDQIDLESFYNALRSLILTGSQTIPPQLITNMEQNLLLTIPTTPLCAWNSHFYFQKFWRYESEIISHFETLISQKPKIEVDLNRAEKLIEANLSANALLPEQADAIRAALNNRFTIICGGPGTGKTYTAGLLIRLFKECLPESVVSHCEFALAAPTGKAAANLQNSLLKACGDLPELAGLKAKTLHALLEIKTHKEYRPQLLNADFIIVDECSMIDAKMMNALLSAIKPGARLIFLGDPHQLPPVEAGGIFGDLVAYLSTKKNRSVSHLSVCLRADLKAIVDFSLLINQGNASQVIDFFNKENTITLNPVPNLKDILESAKKHFPSFWDGHSDPGKFLDLFQQFRILTPFRKGATGVEGINQTCYNAFQQEIPDQSWFAIPIIIVKNDYRIGLFNGEVGVLLKRKNDSQEVCAGDFAIFPSKDSQSEAPFKIPALLLPRYEYAYCLSVHKSQGSEFNRVLLLLPEGSEKFGREVLYTAVTRARQSLALFGLPQTIEQTIRHVAHRQSGLPLRLEPL